MQALCGLEVENIRSIQSNANTTVQISLYCDEVKFYGAWGKNIPAKDPSKLNMFFCASLKR